jgi:UDP-N-acetyl-D-mannosaminuronate dehydrogenase
MCSKVDCCTLSNSSSRRPAFLALRYCSNELRYYWEGRAGNYDALEGADGVVILTEWNEFRALDFARVKAALKTPLMVDLRNIYRPAQMTEAGFRYISVGR